MRVQMLAVLLLFVSLLCAEGIRAASLAGGSESQQSEEGRGESKMMVKREAKAPDFVCRFCYNCCPGNSGFGFCCSS
ncbi:unnamed protein product [Eretmochelys imbricata]